MRQMLRRHHDLGAGDFNPDGRLGGQSFECSSQGIHVVVIDGIKDRDGLLDKLGINAYNVDTKAHIWIIDRDICLQCEKQQCINCCPAACYEPQPDGRVLFSYEGCVECGTCRIVCNEFDNVGWTYPRGGFGIQYRYG